MEVITLIRRGLNDGLAVKKAFLPAGIASVLLFALTNLRVSAGWTVAGSNPFPSLTFGTRIIAADFNNDGKLDILYQTGNTSGTGFALQLGNGDGTFQAAINKPAGSAFTAGPLTGIDFTQMTGVVAVDLNGDGKVDLVDAQGAGATPLVYLNNGSGFTTLSSPFPAQSFTGRMIFGDFNNDGYVDVLNQPSNVSGNGVTLYLNNANGTISFTAIAKPDGAAFASGPLAGLNFTQVNTTTVYPVDLNGDGKVDLVDAQGASATPIVYRNTGAGFTTAVNPFPAQAFTGRFVFGDFDSDGYVDVLNQAGNVSGTAITLYMNNKSASIGFTTIAQPTASAFTSGPFTGIAFTQLTGAAFIVGDFDNDTDIDVDESQNTTSRYLVQSGSPPRLAGSSPADNATGVATTANVVLTFDQTVVKGAGGNVVLKKTSDNSTVATIPVAGTGITGSGTTYTVATGVTLSYSTGYYVLIDKAAFASASGAIYSGITSSTALNFTTTTPPPPPTITSSLTATGSYRSPISTYTIAASGSPTSFGASGLPAGLAVNTANGQITGTPTQSGGYNAAISATNAGGPGSATLVFTIAKASLTVSGITASNKVYDTTTNAALNFSSAALVGVLGGDNVTLNTAGAVGAFADSSVGAGKLVTITGLTLLGTPGTNYTLTQPTSTASINPPAPIPLGITFMASKTAQVYWAFPSTGFNLQQSTNLSTTNWITPAETVSNNGSINFIQVSPGSTNRYFRLKFL